MFDLPVVDHIRNQENRTPVVIIQTPNILVEQHLEPAYEKTNNTIYFAYIRANTTTNNNVQHKRCCQCNQIEENL